MISGSPSFSDAPINLGPVIEQKELYMNGGCKKDERNATIPFTTCSYFWFRELILLYLGQKRILFNNLNFEKRSLLLHIMI